MGHNIFFGGGRTYVPYEKSVTINRAPTDESIKLYGEVLEKARESLVAHIPLGNNINGIISVYRIEYDDLYEFRLKLVINGRVYTKTFKPTLVYGMDNYENVRNTIREIVEYVANTIVSETIDMNKIFEVLR